MQKTFAKGSGVYKCVSCGRNTRKTDPDSAELQLCRQCYEGCGMLNQHNDNGHVGNLANCQICAAEMDDDVLAHIKANPDLF